MHSRLGDPVCDLNFALRQWRFKVSAFNIVHSISLDSLVLQVGKMRL